MTVRWTVRAANDRGRDRAARVDPHRLHQIIKTCLYGRSLLFLVYMGIEQGRSVSEYLNFPNN